MVGRYRFTKPKTTIPAQQRIFVRLACQLKGYFLAQGSLRCDVRGLLDVDLKTGFPVGSTIKESVKQPVRSVRAKCEQELVGGSRFPTTV